MIRIDPIAGPKLTELIQLECDACRKVIQPWCDRHKFEIQNHNVHETNGGRHYCLSCTEAMATKWGVEIAKTKGKS